ncbi:UNVERIFIED_CONTAM: hypothetical protein Scaly_0071400 [Sesamum calycinum]|uniref:Uncharacterized protein n=1 Tax=Sesamum calycinum TaxID=2727403 RepID=A0AAW2SUF9_9LAMI
MPQPNDVSKRKNRTLLDTVRSMMSFYKLLLWFWEYALETAAKLLNMVPSKTVTHTSYQIWHGKLLSYKYLKVWGIPAYFKRLVGDRLDSSSSLCRSTTVPNSLRGFVLKLNGGVVAWKSFKQDITVYSTTEANYVVALQAVRRQFG